MAAGKLARSAAEIAELGRELYERLAKFDEHIGGIEEHLEKAMKFYNSAVGTLESRVPDASSHAEPGPEAGQSEGFGQKKTPDVPVIRPQGLPDADLPDPLAHRKRS
jgi:DNA recombination protein RmuC